MKIIHPVGDTHFGIKSLFAGVHVKIQKGWRIQFFDMGIKKRTKRSKWENQYVMYKPTKLVFKVLFVHTEGGRTWLHRTCREDKYGVIEGFDTRYCKVISELEYEVLVL